MAHLWIEETADDWAVLPLETRRFDLAALRAGEVSGAVFSKGDAADLPAWYLLAPPDERIWVNGIPLAAGLHVMNDQDEVRLARGEMCFFSSEMLARVEPMPATVKPMTCPRCRQHIEPDSPAIRCPQCGIWHHETDTLNCFSYGVSCAMCSQPSALDAGYLWTPMGL